MFTTNFYTLNTRQDELIQEAETFRLIQSLRAKTSPIARLIALLTLN